MPRSTLKVKLLNDKAQLPKQMSAEAVGFDLFVDKNYNLMPRTVTKVTTGIAVSIPKGYYGEIHIRSSWGKRAVRLANCTGIIDSDYRGELLLMIYNDNKDDILWLKEGTRIAQLILVKQPAFTIKEVDDLDKTARGEGGFGSTNKKENK